MPIKKNWNWRNYKGSENKSQDETYKSRGTLKSTKKIFFKDVKKVQKN